MDISTLVSEATGRAHRALCVNPDDCAGPSEIELMITACVLESTMPKILGRITLELRQALHGMAAGQMTPGEPDALSEDPDELLKEWLIWYQSNMDSSLMLPRRMHVRTAAYLAARKVTSE